MRNFLDPRLQGGLRWLHYHLTAALLILLGLSWSAAGGYFAAKHFQSVKMTQVTNTGYKSGPLPPLTKVSGGPALPPYFSLAPYLVRIHNQGASFSCVGQTLSTAAEIIECERYKRNHPRARYCPAQWFSSGWIWNPFNGGNFYSGMSYSDAFPRWQYSGMAPINEFWPDGWNGWTVYPPAFTATSYRYHIATWRQLSAYDTYSIEQYIHAGFPIAIAMGWDYSLSNNYGYGGTIWSQSGQYMYSHSVTGIGYSPDGVLIQNSYGPGWGVDGRATFSWGLLRAMNAVIVVGVPANALPPFKTITKPSFPIARWHAPIDRWNASHPRHKRKHIPYRWHGTLSRVASDAWHHGMLKRIGGPLRREIWDPKKRVMHQVFGFRIGHPQATLWTWPTFKHDPIRYEAHHRTIRISRY